MTWAGLIAHQGGWDEILFVVVPLVLFGGLLLLARRRVDQMDAIEEPADDEEAAPATESGDTEPR